MAREYRDSGIEWIGQIPKQWEVNKINRLFSTIGSGTTPTSTDNDAYIGHINWIQSGDLNGSVLEVVKNRISEDTLSKYSALTVYNAPFIIIAMYGASVGNISISTIDGCCNQACCVLCKSNINFKYAFYAIKSSQRYLVYKAVGGGQPNISQNTLKQLWIPVPNLPAQQKITDFLDKVCGEVDEMVALQETMIEELKAYKQSVITEAVTKGLNPNVPMRDSGIDWIGETPEHWDIVPIKYIKGSDKNAFADGPFGSNLKSEHFIENGDVIVIESGNITTGKFIYKDFKTISKEHFETIRRSECKENDVIIAKIGANYGMAGILPLLDKPSVVSGNSLKITLDDNKMINSIFVYLMMSAKWNNGFKGLVQENAQPALSLSGLNNFRMPYAPLPEQRIIASYLDTKCSEIDSLIALKQAKIEELKEYKKSVIYEYVTGKKEVV